MNFGCIAGKCEEAITMLYVKATPGLGLPPTYARLSKAPQRKVEPCLFEQSSPNEKWRRACLGKASPNKKGAMNVCLKLPQRKVKP